MDERNITDYNTKVTNSNDNPIFPYALKVTDSGEPTVHQDILTLENGTTTLNVPFKPRYINLDIYDSANHQSTYVGRGRATVNEDGSITQDATGSFRSDASNHSRNVFSEEHIVAMAYWNGSGASQNARSAITSVTQLEDETWDITFTSSNLGIVNIKKWFITIHK